MLLLLILVIILYFTINDTKLYVPVVTLSKEDNKDFIEQQNKGFQRSIYWNEYKTK